MRRRVLCAARPDAKIRARLTRRSPRRATSMSSYHVQSYTVRPVDGDDQVEVVIHASDGSKWEYGIPFSRATGRYLFEEIDVLANDFGDAFAEELKDKIDALVATLKR
jgi:hypothetical protein